MKGLLLALYCVIIVILSACSGPMESFIEYAPPPPAARQEVVPLVYPAEPPEPAAVADALPDAADESLGADDEGAISDFSVTQDGTEINMPDADLYIYGHYIEENEVRYRSFLEAYPDLSTESSLALVNINADYGYYNGISAISNPESLLVLCNKNHQLPIEYIPEKVSVIKGTSYTLREEAAEAFELMREAMKDGLGLPLVVVSAYRDYTYQENLYRKYFASDGERADTYSARAGHSEHQTGLAVDLLHKSSSGSLRGAGFQHTAQYAWMQSHAHQYGFILRYPEGSESITGYRFEPWHWRYIGVEDATRMFEEGFATFEEYIGTVYATSTPV
ncbi:MAG: M15 family metallopeptidase [Oscillospiraceae bacterium]|nr:M15 family metallopeptidase [Oscillospiraceae bacterium]